MPLQISLRTWLALAALGPVIYVLVQSLPLLRSVFLLLLVTAFLSLLIHPVAVNMERRGMSRSQTTVAVLLGTLALFAGLVLLLLPILFDSLARLAGLLEGLAAQVSSGDDIVIGPLDLGDLGGSLIDLATNTMRWGLGQIGGVLGSVGFAAFGGFVAFAIIVALVGSPTTAQALLRILLPVRLHARVSSLTAAVSGGLSRWFVAQLLICSYYAVSYSVIGLLVGIPFAVQIGVISGLLEFIPYLGGIVGMGLAILSAATVSTTAVIMIVVLEGIVGMVAVYVVVPYAFSRAIDVPPALILFGLFIGGLVGGFFAALLTVPLIASLMVILRELRPDIFPTREEPAKPTTKPARTSGR
ncbi:MAG: AI-2E family transporter [Oscillochloridaceae bacterium umkhey_bin13]